MPKKISKKQWIKFASIISAFVILLIGLYIRLLNVRKDASRNEAERIASPVRTITPNVEDITLYRSVLGKVEGGQTVSVYTDVNGWVRSIKVSRGDHVNKGDIILTLEDKRTEYDLNESRSRLESEKAEYKELKRQYEQNKILYQKGIVARDTLDSSQNKLKAKESMVNSLEAAYRRDEWEYGQLTIKSPIEGKVTEILPDKGQEMLVNQEVARIVNISRKKVIAGVDASIVKRIGPDTKIIISSDNSEQTTEERGSVLGVSKNTDENSNLYTLEVNIESEDNNLLPGEIVTLRIPYAVFKNVIKVPVSTVYSDEQNYYVFIDDNGKSRKVPVEIKWINDKYGVIPSEFIPENTRIITEGSAALRDGEQIRILQ